MEAFFCDSCAARFAWRQAQEAHEAFSSLARLRGKTETTHDTK